MMSGPTRPAPTLVTVAENSRPRACDTLYAKTLPVYGAAIFLLARLCVRRHQPGPAIDTIFQTPVGAIVTAIDANSEHTENAVTATRPIRQNFFGRVQSKVKQNFFPHCCNRTKCILCCHLLYYYVLCLCAMCCDR